MDKNDPFFRHIDPEELKNDLELLLGAVDANNALGLPTNPVEVAGIYAYVLADTFDREKAYRKTMDYIQTCTRNTLN